MPATSRVVRRLQEASSTHPAICQTDGPVLSVPRPGEWESTPPFTEDTVTTVLLVVVTRVPLETMPLPGLMAIVNCH